MSYSYAVEHARSGRSHCTGRCRKEGKLIPFDCWRFGSTTEANGTPMTFWRYVCWVWLRVYACVMCVSLTASVGEAGHAHGPSLHLLLTYTPTPLVGFDPAVSLTLPSPSLPTPLSLPTTQLPQMRDAAANPKPSQYVRALGRLLPSRPPRR